MFSVFCSLNTILLGKQIDLKRISSPELSYYSDKDYGFNIILLFC